MFRPERPGREGVAVAAMVPVAAEEEGSTEEEWREEECSATAVEEEVVDSDLEAQRGEMGTVRPHRRRTTVERPTSC